MSRLQDEIPVASVFLREAGLSESHRGKAGCVASKHPALAGMQLRPALITLGLARRAKGS